MNNKDSIKEKIKGWGINENIMTMFEELPAYLQHGNRLAKLSIDKIGENSYGLRYSNTKNFYKVDNDLEKLLQKALEIIRKQYPDGVYKPYKTLSPSASARI